MTGYAVVRADGTVAKEAWVKDAPRPEKNARSWAAWLEEFDAPRAPFRVEAVSRDA